MLNKIELSSALLIIITTTICAYTVSYDFEQSVQLGNWAVYNSKDNIPWQDHGGMGDSGCVAVENYAYGPPAELSLETLTFGRTAQISFYFMQTADRVRFSFGNVELIHDGVWGGSALTDFGGTVVQQQLNSGQWYLIELFLNNGVATIKINGSDLLAAADWSGVLSQYGNAFSIETWWGGDGHRAYVDNFTITADVPACGCSDYIAHATTSAGDLNNDCSVDLLDLSLLAANWLDCNDPQIADCGP